MGSESNMISTGAVTEQVEKCRELPWALARAAALPPRDSPRMAHVGTWDTVGGTGWH